MGVPERCVRPMEMSMADGNAASDVSSEAGDGVLESGKKSPSADACRDTYPYFPSICASNWTMGRPSACIPMDKTLMFLFHLILTFEEPIKVNYSSGKNFSISSFPCLYWGRRGCFIKIVLFRIAALAVAGLMKIMC